MAPRRRLEVPDAGAPEVDLGSYDALLVESGGGVMSATSTSLRAAAVPTRAAAVAGHAAARAQAADVRAPRRGDGRRPSARAGPLGRYLHHLVELEVDERRRRRIERLLKASELPADKTLATLDSEQLPPKVRQQLPTLCEGGFVERGDNVLAFGLPGRGKTHLVCAIGHELIQRGYRVLFAADLRSCSGCSPPSATCASRGAAALDGFDAVILDDIGYVQQSRDEMEVLFTFLAERYERSSVIITSNLVFQQWDRIFKDPMTTAAAIDRLVHHAVILEMTGDSYRSEQAKSRETVDKAPRKPPGDE